MQAWKDRADADGPIEAANWVAREAPGNADLRGALDAVLENAIAQGAGATAVGERGANTGNLTDSILNTGDHNLLRRTL